MEEQAKNDQVNFFFFFQFTQVMRDAQTEGRGFPLPSVAFFDQGLGEVLLLLTVDGHQVQAPSNKQKSSASAQVISQRRIMVVSLEAGFLILNPG